MSSEVEEATVEKTAEASAKNAEEVQRVLREMPAGDRDLANLLTALLEQAGLSNGADVAASVGEILAKADATMKSLGRQAIPAERARDMATVVRSLAKIISESDSADQAKTNLEQELRRLDETRDNLFRQLFSELRPLEQKLFGLSLLFQNTEGLRGELPERAQVFVVDQEANGTTLAAVRKWLEQENFSFDLARNMGTLLVPGPKSLADRKKLEEIALEMGMLTLSDLEDYTSLDELLDSLEQYEQEGEGLLRGETEASTSAVAAPYVMAREGHSFEREGVWVEPSNILAGAISRSDRSTQNGLGLGQPPSSEQEGKLRGVMSTRFELNQNGVKKMATKQINPVYRGVQKSYILSSTDTLCQDDVLRQYQTRRVLDYVAKRVGNVAWQIHGKLLTRPMVIENFETPVKSMLAEMKKAGLISGFAFSVNYDQKLFNKGKLEVTLAVQPTMVADSITINMAKTLDSMDFQSVD